MMNGTKKSDSSIVPAKPANKVERSTAELVEGDDGTKRNAELQSTVRTQSREAVTQAQARIRGAVIRNEKENRHNLYAIPTQKSLDRFKDQIRALTQRRTPLRMGELIKTINPIIRGWGNYYCRSQVRKRFHQLDGWIVRRLWSHRAKRWRNNCWKDYPTKRLLGEFKLVNLVSLIPSLRISRNHS